MVDLSRFVGFSALVYSRLFIVFRVGGFRHRVCKLRVLDSMCWRVSGFKRTENITTAAAAAGRQQQQQPQQNQQQLLVASTCKCKP